ncbi:hypothetical protein TRFO_37017 [Tritrichomonas foetus]|uniref:Uncharacterized protein n=1 Tax=Tritrichomonas foetus TaxID=1144522 RepID=A0A1J4JHM3_9EUKA|nr:hypothetical protein TRFO_37017 [Tritrichomonas foetus]|eukprot:OHS96764.1 hypothetical protein TRFO_37017 [Tritrichomonas foetus]
MLLETSINIIKNLQIVQNQILDNVKTNNSIIENNKILIEKLQTSQQLIQNDLKTNNNNDESQTLKIQNIETTIRNHNEDNFIQNLNIGKIS